MVHLLVFITVLAHLILPFVFIAWVAFNKGKSRLYRISVAVFVGSFLMTMWLGGAGWHWFGRFWPVLFLILYVPAVYLLIKNLKNVPWLPEKNSLASWVGAVTMVVLALAFATGLPGVLLSRDYPEEALHLRFPLQNGTYHVGQGGSSLAMNHHFGIPAQKYALDIVKLNEWGVRAQGLLPKDLNSYEIFGDQLIAPCSGEVLSVQNELADQTPPQADPANLFGNHVILFCEGYSILLAHMKKGSVQAQVGEQVEAGSVLGEVGNTGNTSEPHLHIHAVKGRFSEKEEVAGTAEGVPILFDGRFLIRNDRLTSTPSGDRK